MCRVLLRLRVRVVLGRGHRGAEYGPSRSIRTLEVGPAYLDLEREVPEDLLGVELEVEAFLDVVLGA